MRPGKIAACILGCIGAVTPVNQVYASGPQIEVSAQAAASATTQKPPLAIIHDVSLVEGNRIVGQVVNNAGEAIPGIDVDLSSGHQIIAQTTTTAEGRFEFATLRGGVYELVFGNQSEVCRFWSPGTSPPSARDSIVLVMDSSTVIRGNDCNNCGQCDNLGCCLYRNRWLITAAAIAGAVAIAVYNANSDEPDQVPASP